jgi:hypothetical protein
LLSHSLWLARGPDSELVPSAIIIRVAGDGLEDLDLRYNDTLGDLPRPLKQDLTFGLVPPTFLGDLLHDRVYGSAGMPHEGEKGRVTGQDDVVL